jgi:hypothetical protein
MEYVPDLQLLQGFENADQQFDQIESGVDDLSKGAPEENKQEVTADIEYKPAVDLSIIVPDKEDGGMGTWKATSFNDIECDLLLLRWTNYHLSQSTHFDGRFRKRRVTNFSCKITM